MAKLNKPRNLEPVYTHQGAKAAHITPELQLRRSVMSCLLWEKEFYEDGETIAERIARLIPEVDPLKVSIIAIEARTKMKLRHVPLLIVREMARLNTYKGLVKDTLSAIIQRPDEMGEFLAIYWKDDNTQPLSAQVKKGLAKAFTKFSEYQLAKYNRKAKVTLKDVMRLVHPIPKTKEQSDIWANLMSGNLSPPDTWEVALSKDDGIPKVIKWERLLKENKLGGLALIRNLRNMVQEGVNKHLIITALENMNSDMILPFRFLNAAAAAPKLEEYIEKALLKMLSNKSKLLGKTILIVDVSGSMYNRSISAQSETDRAKVACSMALITREICEDIVIYATAGNDNTRIHATTTVPNRRGFALSDSIYSQCTPLGGGGIFLKQVMDYVYEEEKTADRIIVITDEQDCDNRVGGEPSKANAFGRNNYLINIASNQNGIGYGKWVHVDGWSEAVIDYIMEYENQIIYSKLRLPQNIQQQ